MGGAAARLTLYRICTTHNIPSIVPIVYGVYGVHGIPQQQQQSYIEALVTVDARRAAPPCTVCPVSMYVSRLSAASLSRRAARAACHLSQPAQRTVGIRWCGGQKVKVKVKKSGFSLI